MKKILIILITFFTFFNGVNADSISLDELASEITATNAIVYNLLDDEVIFEKGSNERVQIASITKVMTAIIALENIPNLDEKVKITWRMYEGLEGYSVAGFPIGSEVTYRDVLYGILLPSGAEAVNAVVLSLGGHDKFISLMNQKASSLNLTNTHFDNPIGMDSLDNYSSAEDIAKLLIYALKNETFKSIFTTRTYEVPSLDLSLRSTLLKYANTIDVSNILGAKSGFTSEAGLCLASIAKINNVDYLMVNLGSDYDSGRSQAVKDTLKVYNYFGDNYSYRTIVTKDQVFTKIKNDWGHEKEYAIYATDNVSLYLANDLDLENLTYIYDGIDEINYKNQKGEKLGTVTISYEGQTLDTYDVYLNDELKYYHPWIYTFIIIGFLLVLFIFRIIQVQYRRYKRRQKRMLRMKN